MRDDDTIAGVTGQALTEDVTGWATETMLRLVTDLLDHNPQITRAEAIAFIERTAPVVAAHHMAAVVDALTTRARH